MTDEQRKKAEAALGGGAVGVLIGYLLRKSVETRVESITPEPASGWLWGQEVFIHVLISNYASTNLGVEVCLQIEHEILHEDVELKPGQNTVTFPYTVGSYTTPLTITAAIAAAHTTVYLGGG